MMLHIKHIPYFHLRRRSRFLLVCYGLRCDEPAPLLGFSETPLPHNWVTHCAYYTQKCCIVYS